MRYIFLWASYLIAINVISIVSTIHLTSSLISPLVDIFIECIVEQLDRPRQVMMIREFYSQL